MFKKNICGDECEPYFMGLFHSMNEGFLLMETIPDTEGIPVGFRVGGWNQSFADMFDINVDDDRIHGERIEAGFLDIEPIWFETCRQVAQSGRRMQMEIYRKASGRYFNVNLLVPAEQQLIALFSDITEVRKADEILKKHAVLFENAYDIIFYLKMDGSIIDANRTAMESYGYSYQELLGMKLQQLRHPSTLKDFSKQMEQSASRGIIFESIHVRKDGTNFPVEVSSRSISLNGELIRINIVRDISERKRAEEQIQYLADHDALTGIANRGYLMRQLEMLLQKSAEKQEQFAVMLFDLDKFKMVNDIYGHNAGDEVLKQIASRLRHSVREGDIIGRLGGDEFVVIQPLIKEKEDSEIIANRILNLVATPVAWKDAKLGIKISIGISFYPKDAIDAERIIECADSAMYRIKRKGGNNYGFFDAVEDSLKNSN